MRKLFSEKAGATFNDGLPTTTVCVRKDCVELVSKIDKGFYAVTNLLSAGNGADDDHCQLGAFLRPTSEP